MTTSGIDELCLSITKKNRNMIVPWWLMASYAYYVEDKSILSDATFDAIAATLGDEWDQVSHRHKHLIDRDMTKSGFYIPKEAYPSIVEGAIAALRSKFKL